MESQANFDCEMGDEREEAGAGDVGHLDQRQVLGEQCRHWGGAARPDPAQTRVNLGDNTPLVAVELEGKKLRAVLDPGPARSLPGPEWRVTAAYT